MDEIKNSKEEIKISDDYFFAFNSFEHCQDSFFGWLFGSGNQSATKLKNALFQSFCGEKVDKSTPVEITKITPQFKDRKHENSPICDLKICGTVGGQKYIVFLEDKTNNKFDSAQMESMAFLKTSCNDKDAKKLLVYCSSSFLTEETVDQIKRFKEAHKGDSFVFVLRKDLEKIVNETVKKDVLKDSNSILGQYYAFINGIIPIENPFIRWTNFDFISFFKRRFLECDIDKYFSLEISGLIDSTDAKKDKTLALYLKSKSEKSSCPFPYFSWETGQKSKGKHELYLYLNGSPKKRFEKIYQLIYSSFLSRLLDTEPNRRFSEGRKAIFKKTFNTQSELEGYLTCFFNALAQDPYKIFED